MEIYQDVIQERDEEISRLKLLVVDDLTESVRERSLSCEKQPDSTSQAPRGPALSHIEDPKMAQIVRFYEDLTNLVITDITKPQSARHVQLKDWLLTCVYSYRDVGDTRSPAACELLFLCKFLGLLSSYVLHSLLFQTATIPWTEWQSAGRTKGQEWPCRVITLYTTWPGKRDGRICQVSRVSQKTFHFWPKSTCYVSTNATWRGGWGRSLRRDPSRWLNQWGCFCNIFVYSLMISQELILWCWFNYNWFYGESTSGPCRSSIYNWTFVLVPFWCRISLGAWRTIPIMKPSHLLQALFVLFFPIGIQLEIFWLNGTWRELCPPHSE